ncbi:SWF/SNF family helicase [Amycolatopsis sp. OK19-0408]|uniref:SWF/SNF family helicase n=1 Tax=Amycolatopsis iheyensis TaxID=2945988 RepID=A0A9X2N8Q6_9PSEU|nr:SWIM zinc finger family protein [Amycolatopsis iheyensis]MCR6482299.1 SWF/SNF family helicase [Amycolatopsis iheyensis]
MSDERVRGFPAFGAAAARGRFAKSWWGRAWLSAMEDTALDLRQLKAGRRYAAAGLVGPITVSPGRIAAVVDDVDGGPYRTELRLAELSEVDWTRFLDRVASRAGHLAALLDRDMPPDLVAAADDAGVHLLPGIGDLDPECDCPGWELPCKHAAALSFQASWLLDADPFVLLLMRGLGEREILDELESRTAPREDVVVGDRTPGELPDLAGFRPSGAPSIPAAPGVPAEAFAVLAANAAAQARAVLAGEPWPGRRADTVRLAASFPEAASRLGEGAEFERAVAAWTHGGRAGLEVLDSAWTPPKPVIAAARAALAEEEPVFERNHCTLGDVQLRLDRHGRWHPYRREDGQWWPSGPPETDPGLLLG